MCIIRNKPNEGIYCIVWFKFSFGQPFEKSDEKCSWMRRLFLKTALENCPSNWAINDEYNIKQLIMKVFFQ